MREMKAKQIMPVQTEKTANLIAQAIIHQKQKAAGLDEEAEIEPPKPAESIGTKLQQIESKP